MKFLILAIIILSLYLIYRLSFPAQAGKPASDKTPPPPSPDSYEAVVKSRFVIYDRSNSAQHDDRTKESDKQDKKPDIFAAGNDNPPPAVIPPDELDDVFGEDMNPEDLEIERDENETGEDDEPELDADEEVEEIRQSVREIEGYAGGFTFDELVTVIHESDTQPDAMTKAAVETLRDFSGTDMFEQLVSEDAGRAARIAVILDRNENSLASQGENMADNSNNEYNNFDIELFLS